MLLDTLALFYILIGCLALVLILAIRRASKVRVWIKTSPKPGAPMIDLGYLNMDDSGACAEAHLSGSGTKAPVGRVVAEIEGAKNNGYVELVTTDINDESVKPHYRQCGFIGFDSAVVDEYGMIYKQIKGKKKRELVGYTARPSAPNTPTLSGERSWKTLWLVCTLHAYLGAPNPDLDKNVEEKGGKGSSMSEGQSTVEPQSTNKYYKQLVINSSEQNEEDIHSIDFSLEDDHEEISNTELLADSIANTDDASALMEEGVSDAEETFNEEDSDSSDADESKNSIELPQPVAPIPVTTPIMPSNKAKIPAAVLHFTGFHSSEKDFLPAEARAGAFALLYQKMPKANYSEFYKSVPYGWKDTSLLTTVIFSILFTGLYVVNTGLMGYPLLGDDWKALIILTAFYFALWALVRFIKIDCIENSNTFQPRLDLFNKNLGMGCMNRCIVIMGLISMYFTYAYYDYDFIPLIFAIILGVGINMTLKNANSRWTISSTYIENDEDEDEGEEIKNPEGDIARVYDWDLDRRYSNNRIHGNLTLYFSANEIHDLRQCNPFFSQRKDKKDKDYILDMFHFLKDHKMFLARVKYIVHVIDGIVEKQGMTPIDRMQFTLDFIQEPNIRFVDNKDIDAINKFEEYIRYPDETLYDKEGDCNSKSLLAAMLFHVMGFNVLYMASRKHEHSAIGVEINKDDLTDGWYGNIHRLSEALITDNGKTFIYCETTGDDFVIGKTIDGMHLEDFEERVLLPLNEDGDEAEDNGYNRVVSRIYNWELDSIIDKERNKLNGNITLDFEEGEISNLRSINPFQTYGRDANTYEMNIRSIFNFILGDSYRMEKVKAIAIYIKKVIEEKNYPELDLVQFALDFAQAPNITYCIDENSAGIEFAKEYMRFPDEVLFDKEGDCDCKSSLTAALFHCLGYNVIVMLSQKLQHAAIGIEAKADWLLHIKNENIDTVLRNYNGRRYLYCETTGDGYTIGQIKDNDSIHDFETIVEIPV